MVLTLKQLNLVLFNFTFLIPCIVKLIPDTSVYVNSWIFSREFFYPGLYWMLTLNICNMWTKSPRISYFGNYKCMNSKLYYVGWGAQNCGKIADVILEHFLTRIKLSQSYSFNSLSTHWSTTQIIDVLPGNLSYITSSFWWLPPHPP